MAGRIRTIKPEWLEDELLAREPDHVRLLSIVLILIADDHGRGRAAPEYVTSQAYMYTHFHNPHESLTRVRESLTRLSRARFIVLYECDGQTYFEIRNWQKHQKVQHVGKERVPGSNSSNSKVLELPHEDSGDSREASGDTHSSLPPDLRPHISDLIPLFPKTHVAQPDTGSLPVTHPTPSPPVPSAEPAEPPRRARAPRATQPPKPDSHPRHQEVMNFYHQEFLRARGEKPSIGGAEGSAVKRLLKAMKGDADRAMAIIHSVYADPRSFNARNATILTIAHDPSKYLGTSGHNGVMVPRVQRTDGYQAIEEAKREEAIREAEARRGANEEMF